MTIYNLIKDYRLPLIILKRHGYVTSSLARDLKVYEQYLHLEDKGVESKKQLAKSHNIGIATLYRIIKTLSTRA